MWGYIFAIFIILWVVINSRRFANHEKNIREKIKTIGGEVLKIEKIGQLPGIGFPILKNTIYRIEYQRGGEAKEGWVKFRGIASPVWKL